MAPIVEGLIEIDGIDVISSKCPLSRSHVRSKLGIIPQDSWLFSGTLRSNLNITGEYSDAQLETALRLTNLGDMLEGLEGGLGAEVHEKGSNFSAGQVQLVCLARVILKDPAVVFMDEATASVDLKTDTLVQQTIRTTLIDCSILTIAHRLGTIIDYDRVVVINKGRVEESGSPHELLQQPRGSFTALVEAGGPATATELRERALAAQLSQAASSAPGGQRTHLSDLEA